MHITFRPLGDFMGSINRFVNLGLLLSIMWSSVPAWTQSPPVRQSARGVRHAPMDLAVDQGVARLTKALQLSDEQQTALQQILERRRWEFRRNRQDSSLSGSERIE